MRGAEGKRSPRRAVLSTGCSPRGCPSARDSLGGASGTRRKPAPRPVMGDTLGVSPVSAFLSVPKAGAPRDSWAPGL